MIRNTIPGTAPTPRDMEYLRFACAHGDGEAAVPPSALAADFGVSRVSAMEKLRRLAAMGYGHYVRGKGLVVNERGREAIRLHLRKHRILECFLDRNLGLDHNVGCREAARIDFYLSDDMVDLISDALGHPTVCPCGNPIPPGPSAGGGGSP
ncbi:MAG TPA: metal-dependent transcriptional regulator [Thermoplasmata archaeon]|nr:metal-dependent transcriptional regulator [Thermoplasmata archaeon]